MDSWGVIGSENRAARSSTGASGPDSRDAVEAGAGGRTRRYRFDRRPPPRSVARTPAISRARTARRAVDSDTSARAASVDIDGNAPDQSVASR
ncbi:hypothetical protein CC117_29360 [Parafrankia colletiae]|uniref:Uncharacterized protein n=1 Tax=Parafrankia colletiae TaxID=573497 RepID=A0A1S1Q2B4_9ACTN|nr:hypothetical protein [Parafrankia colletiae]MCK9902158.1 hypothetical protein [Frankia sp. Cpl3]OHV29043.1 hypothetical protein CC117_29360 [Parafrankia colletiae]